jgi:hypothetical protein
MTLDKASASSEVCGGTAASGRTGILDQDGRPRAPEALSYVGGPSWRTGSERHGGSHPSRRRVRHNAAAKAKPMILRMVKRPLPPHDTKAATIRSSKRGRVGGLWERATWTVAAGLVIEPGAVFRTWPGAKLGRPRPRFRRCGDYGRPGDGTSTAARTRHRGIHWTFVPGLATTLRGVGGEPMPERARHNDSRNVCSSNQNSVHPATPRVPPLLPGGPALRWAPTPLRCLRSHGHRR